MVAQFKLTGTAETLAYNATGEPLIEARTWESGRAICTMPLALRVADVLTHVTLSGPSICNVIDPAAHELEAASSHPLPPGHCSAPLLVPLLTREIDRGAVIDLTPKISF
jgi:hypothetical protein